jgi:hypothetical protein
MTGKTFLGENIRDPKVFIKSMALPFAWQEAGNEPILGTAIGFIGVKSTPLSPNELLTNKMIRAGIDPEDPLERRQYLTLHPEDKPKARGDERIAAELVTDSTKEKQSNLEELVLSDNMTLAEFKEARKSINRDQRNKLSILLGTFDREPKNAQQTWIKSFYDLYEAARDPLTGELNGTTLDKLQAQWLNTFGSTALRYVNEFSLVGKGEVETSYLEALGRLEEKGYFNIPRLRNMRSDLSEDQIEEYRSMVQAARFASNRLTGFSFADSAQITLRELGLSGVEVRDVINSGSGNYQNPEYHRFLRNNKELVVWTNQPHARWSTVQAVTGKQ